MTTAVASKRSTVKVLLTVTESDEIGSDLGRYYHHDRLIRLRKGLADSQYRAVLLHEVIHHIYSDVAPVGDREHWATHLFARSMIRYLDSLRAGTADIEMPAEPFPGSLPDQCAAAAS
jgi:hypothetical protein